MYELLRFLPRNHLSWAIGTLAHIPLPIPLAQLLIHWFSKSYGVDLNEVERPLEAYPSLGLFFTRNLAPGARPIGLGLVSPVDGTLRNFGPIEHGVLEQVKGKTYTLHEFLGEAQEAEKFSNGYFLNFYLSPPDYHHVHAPIEGTVTRVVHIPGTLWPVNDWSLHAISKLFAVNERVIVYLETAVGPVAVVFVGATNVGKISLDFAPLVTNTFGASKVRGVYPIEPAYCVEKGARLGTFHLGSTAVVLLRDSAACTPIVTAPRKVRLGEQMAEIRG